MSSSTHQLRSWSKAGLRSQHPFHACDVNPPVADLLVEGRGRADGTSSCGIVVLVRPTEWSWLKDEPALNIDLILVTAVDSPNHRWLVERRQAPIMSSS